MSCYDPFLEQELEEAARTLGTRVENGTRSLCVVHAELTVCQKVLDAKNGAPADFDALLALAHPSKSKAASQVFNSFPKRYPPLVPPLRMASPFAAP